MASEWTEAREEVVLYGRRMLAERLVFFTGGNLSRRVAGDGRLIAVTPTSRPYDTMRPEDVVILTIDGEWVDGSQPPTSELPLHALVYQQRPEVGAVVHSHSPAAMAMAIADRTLPPILTGLVYAAGGSVVTAPYAKSGTAEMAEHTRAALADRSACFLRHHGLLTVGATLADAYDAAAVVEGASDAYLRALASGGRIDELPPDEVESIHAKWAARWPGTPQ